jgi:hypothetical protein
VFLFLATITIIPIVMANIMLLVKIALAKQNPLFFSYSGILFAFSLFISLLTLFLIFSMIFFYFVMKGYGICCVNDVDFRNSVISSLNYNSIKFEEKMDKIELVDINNELNVPFNAWFGAGTIRIKNKKDKLILQKIIDGIEIYFKGNNIESKKNLAIVHLIIGIFFIAFTISSIILNEASVLPH